jgi:hypothetical protein
MAALSRGFDRGFLVAAAVMLAATVVGFAGFRVTDGRHVPEMSTAERNR